MSVSGVNFSGLSSGINWKSIIDATATADRAPEQAIKNDIKNLQTKQTAYNTVSAQLINLQAAAFSLDGLRSFDIVNASTSNTDVATATAQTGAQTGTHTITVSALAQSQKIASTAQSSQTAPLGFSGQIIVNGKAVNVNASDSLQTLAGNINAAQTGVNASIISPNPNQFLLTLGSNNAGLQGKFSISDTAGGTFLANTLGYFGTGSTLRHTVSAGVAGSDLFADSATSVATLEGQTAIPPTTGSVSITSGSVTKSVTIDLSKSLSGIASDINLAFGSSVASTATVIDPISGASKQQLQLTGISGASALVDSNNVLANLGLTQRSYAANGEVQAAKDASFTIDGISASRPSNTLTDVISGVTVNLLKDAATAGTPQTTTLTVSSDTSTIKSNISTFVAAFNSTVDAISSRSLYDSSTNSTGILFGDATTAGVADTLTAGLTGQIPGLPGNLSALSQIGVSLDQGGHLNVDDTALSNALSGNLKGVAKIFQAYGTASDPTVQFVSSSGDTRPSPLSGYAVNITQAAKQAVITAGSALTGPLGQDEVLTFSGSVLGSAPSASAGHQITLKAGSSLSDIVSQINGDAKLGPALSASISNNALVLTTKQYGSNAELAVASSIPTSTGNTIGIGNTLIDQKGLDVAGTINGEAAIGVGQFLTGSQKANNGTANGSALGLQLRVTATTAGSYGNIVFTSGAADFVKNYVTGQSDAFSGALSLATNALQDSITADQTNISDIEAQVTAHSAALNDQFASVEGLLSQINSTRSSLAALGSAASSSGGRSF